MLPKASFQGFLARMAELADALDSGSSGVTPVEVQVLFFAPFSSDKQARVNVGVVLRLSSNLAFRGLRDCH
jgi:hypothetical protein